jgi:hypothetical protein
VALEQDLRVVGERGDDRPRHVGGAARELDPQRRALARGLDDDREVQALLDVRQRLGGAELLERGLAEGVEVGRGHAGVAQVVLGHDLVHAADAGRRAGGGVGHADQLEQLLHGAVLAARAVQGDERDVGRHGAQAVDEVGADVHRDDLVAEARQRILHPGAGAQRDLALERAPALEHRDLHARLARRCSGTTLGPSGADGRSAGAAGSVPVSVP